MTSATPKIHPEIEDIFRRCVVRIPARGTGFFIAPGYVLTCAHLFEDRARRAKVQWGTRNWEADVHYLETDKSLDHVDLALLEIVPIDGQVEHPCVLMSDDLSRGDHLFVFGHPQSEFEVNGDCLNFHYGGPSRDKHGVDYIRTPGDRAERGFSGSPVLNLRTMHVCGVLAKSLNLNAPEGGRILPIKLAFGAFPDVCDKSHQYHQAEGQWPDLLPAARTWFDVAASCRKTVETMTPAFSEDLDRKRMYVKREIEDRFRSFVGGDFKAMVITGQSGMGKTTLIQNLLYDYSGEGHLCAMFESAYVPVGTGESIVERHILHKLYRGEVDIQDFWETIGPESLKRNRCLILFVDAVNEYNSSRQAGSNPTEFLACLDKILRETREHPKIKFVITCRPEIWRLAARTTLRYVSHENDEIYYRCGQAVAHELPRFSEEEVEAAYENFRSAREVRTPFADLSDLARYQLRDPLLLTLASEVYEKNDIPPDLDTGEIFGEYYKSFETCHTLIEVIVVEMFVGNSSEPGTDAVKRTEIVRDLNLQRRNPLLYEWLGETRRDCPTFHLKDRRVLREWTSAARSKNQQDEIKIQFTYDRFAEFLLSRELLKRIRSQVSVGKAIEEVAVATVGTNLGLAQQSSIVFGTLQRTLLALKTMAVNYAIVLEKIAGIDERGLSLVISVLAHIARKPEGGFETFRKLLEKFEGDAKGLEQQARRFPLIDTVYRVLRNDEYRMWLVTRPERERQQHIELLYRYFSWGFQHPDSTVSASAIQYLFFLWQSDKTVRRAGMSSFDDAIHITDRIIQVIRPASIAAYLFHEEQLRVLPNLWGLFMLVIAESREEGHAQSALASFRSMIRQLNLRRSAAFRLLLPLRNTLTRYLMRIMSNLKEPIKLKALDSFYANPERNLKDFDEVMSFFELECNVALLPERVAELSRSQNSFVLQMLTFALSVCYERQAGKGAGRECLELIDLLFHAKDAAATSQYCASLALYHINYFGHHATIESMELMGRMAPAILQKWKGVFPLGDEKPSFNIIGTYGRALYVNKKLLEENLDAGAIDRPLQYAFDALEHAKAVKDFPYYLYICENIGLLGVLIEPGHVFEVISRMLRDLELIPKDEDKALLIPFHTEQREMAKKTVLKSLANIRVLYRQEVDRYLLDELDSQVLFAEVANRGMAEFNLATFYSWAFEQLMFRVLTTYYEELGRDVVKMFIDCAHTGSAKACVGLAVDWSLSRVNSASA